MDFKTFYPPILYRRLLQVRFQRANPDAPWLTESAVLLLDSWLKRSDRGWEWGSGRSTTWFAERVAHLTSIEHHEAWHKKVSEKISTLKVAGKVDYRHIPCDSGDYGDVPAHPYSDSILSIPDSSLDFVLVDGVIRRSCFANAISKVKTGGLLILDNAERFVPDVYLGRMTSLKWGRTDCKDPVWADLEKQLGNWRILHTSDGISDTRIWVKSETGSGFAK